MQSGVKAAIGATVVLVLAVGVRVGLIYRERHAPVNVKAPEREKIADDDLVFLKQKRQSSMADVKDLVGTTVWVSAGGQLGVLPVCGTLCKLREGSRNAAGRGAAGGEGFGRAGRSEGGYVPDSRWGQAGADGVYEAE